MALVWSAEGGRRVRRSFPPADDPPVQGKLYRAERGRFHGQAETANLASGTNCHREAANDDEDRERWNRRTRGRISGMVAKASNTRSRQAHANEMSVRRETWDLGDCQGHGTHQTEYGRERVGFHVRSRIDNQTSPTTECHSPGDSGPRSPAVARHDR